MKQSDKVFVPSDKTRNWYEIPVQQYQDLKRGAIVAEYQKCSEAIDEVKAVNIEAAGIARDLQLDDRIEPSVTPRHL